MRFPPEITAATRDPAGIFTSPTLTSIVDANFPAPGLPLTFVRQFQQSLIGRFTVGPFGRGWTDNWQISASTDAQGNAEVASAGSIRFFAKQANGSYLGIDGDHGTLTKVNGVSRAVVDFDKRLVVIDFDDAKTSVQQLTLATAQAGYPSTVRENRQ